MLEDDLLITSLLAKKSVKNVLNLKGVALYLFGSAVRKKHINDLDFLIVYDKSYISVTEALSLRQSFSNSLSVDLGMNIDVVLLNTLEAEQTNFGPMEGAILVSSMQNLSADSNSMR